MIVFTLFSISVLQFIVVSLKDGMFNNANVLFKTKFVDGVSTVTRHVQQQSHHHGHGSSADKENMMLSRGKKTSAASKRQRLESSAR